MKSTAVRHRARIDVDTGELRFRLVQNVSPILAHAKSLRDIEGTKDAAKTEYQHVASLDMCTVMAIRDKYGIDAMNPKPGEAKKLHQIVQREYPLLKTVNKRIG